MNLVIALLVLLVSGNVALLMFARAATRESEIVVRTALGASRARLVGQFVAEALVLSAIAAIAGLTLGQQAMAWGVTTFIRAANDGELLPFWITSTLPPMSIAYGIGLAMVATVVTGILPAIKMTNGDLVASARDHRGRRRPQVRRRLDRADRRADRGHRHVSRHRVYCQEGGLAGRRPADRRADGTVSDGRLGARERHDAGAIRNAACGACARISPPSPASRASRWPIRLPLMWNGHHVIEMDEGGEAPTDERARRRPSRQHGGGRAGFFRDVRGGADRGPPAGAGRLRRRAARRGRQPVVRQERARRPQRDRPSHSIPELERRQPPQQQWIEIVGVVRDMGMAVEPSAEDRRRLSAASPS